MAQFDISEKELLYYTPEVQEETDFDTFWTETLHEARQLPLQPVFEEIEHPFPHLKVFDVSFSGYGGHIIKGWFVRPAQEGTYPCHLEFVGYGGGRSLPHEWTLLPSAGIAHFIMDTRGQGSVWSPGDTPDPETQPGNPQYPGFMTRGILSEKTYYYRRVFTDAVRAFDTLVLRNDVDTSRISAGGGSQGGGITLAVAGLISDIKCIFADVPFLCHFHRAVRLVDSYPYGEIRDFLKTHRDKSEQVHRTLSYFDGVNFAKRARAQAFFSTSLMDDVCPPSTVYAAYNAYAGSKSMDRWEFNGHEGGGPHQKAKQLKRMLEVL